MRKLLTLLLLISLGLAAVSGQAQFTNFPNGVTSFGIPQLGDGTNIPRADGKVFFVDQNQTGALNGGDCETRENPCVTIQAAINKAVSGRGDIIFVAWGTYAENLTVSKDYLTIQGMLFGYGKPDVCPTSGLALDVTAQGFISRYIRYCAPAADVHLVRQRGNGFLYEYNVFDGDSTMGNAKCLLQLKGDDDDDSYTASEGFVRYNLFRGSGGVGICFVGAEAPGNGVGTSDNVIGPGNLFYSQDQSDLETQDNTSTDALYSIQFTLIYGNYFMDKNATDYIDFTTANGGAAGDQSCTIANNWFADDALDGTKIAITGTACTFVGNYDTVGVQDGSAFD